MLIIIAYDIADNRRRRRVAKVLEGYGYRVQESVFECYLSKIDWQTLRHELARYIQHDKDLVRYYALCAKDSADIKLMGNAQKSVNSLFYTA